VITKPSAEGRETVTFSLVGVGVRDRGPARCAATGATSATAAATLSARRKLLVAVLIVLELMIVAVLVSNADRSTTCGNHVYGSSVYFGCGISPSDL
jgi:hypothetical protein